MMLAWLIPLLVRLSVARFAVKRRVAAQGLVEYALILVFVAIVCIAILATIGQTTCTLWYDKIYKEMLLGSPATATSGCGTT